MELYDIESQSADICWSQGESFTQMQDMQARLRDAELAIRTSTGERVTIDSRPSDAIALGVAADTPIYVEEDVIESATQDEL